MGSKSSAVQDPDKAKRFTFTSYMVSLGKRFSQISSHDELDVFVPTAYRWLRVILAGAIERDEEIEQELREIDEDETFLAEARKRRTRVDQNPQRIAQRERLYAKMECLERLAERKGLWGREERPPDETADEIFADQEFDGLAVTE